MSKKSNLIPLAKAEIVQLSAENQTLDPPILRKSTKQRLSIFKVTPRQLNILISSTLSRLLLTYTNAIFNPIFPDEAKQKGLDSFEISTCFGIFYFIVFITAPLIGKYLIVLEPNLVFISSLYVGGFSCLLLAYTHNLPGGSSYFAIIFVLRSILALSYSGLIVATQAIVSYEFHTYIATANGILQAGIILGYVIGPAVSGFLYEAGGYVLPFYLIGGIDIFYGIIIHATLPPSYGMRESTINNDKKKLTFWKLFRSPLNVTSMLCIISGVMGISNIDATLTLHLMPFGISMGLVGLIFSLVDLVNAISNSVCAYFVDSYRFEFPAVIAGNGGVAVGLFVLGRSFFLSNLISSSLATIFIALILIGIGFGMSLISLLKCLVLGTVDLGYEKDDLEVMGHLSGLFNSFVMLGGFLGQFVIGIIASQYSIVVGYTVIGFINGLSCLITVCVFAGWWKKHKNMESTS